ncbi:MAG: flavin reductase [Odoribacteraceae bacterium]|jgi:flavin reductase (DIM6/NTAB) family NADH-FMN oxidoreductase RutF|nr:flavin reductase [Odoribacteraceae bacterium]
MRNSLILLLGIVAGCKSPAPKSEEKAAVNPPAAIQKVENVKEKTFDELFVPVAPRDITGNVFRLVGEDFTVITAGTTTAYNSMTASYGGWGILFNAPSTWCFLRANRYTLECIRRERKYTMVYFDEAYRDQVMLFGSSSGRDGDKMKRHTLSAVETPAGCVAYKEAKLVIECELTSITTVHPDDYFSPEGKSFVTDAFAEANDYHKLVFGKITGTWIRRP